MKLRASGVIMLAGLVLGSLLTGPGAAQLPSLSPVPALPSLSVAELLDIVQVDRPPAGVGLEVHADFPIDAPLVLDGIEIHSLTVDLTPNGNVITRSANAADSGGSREVVGECDDPAFASTGVRWVEGTMPIKWNLDLWSAPENLKLSRTVYRVRAAHRIWPQAKSKCGSDDDITFKYDYTGPKRANPGYDGVNVVDFGALKGNALAVNYTWYQGSHEIVEVDLRLNKVDYNWSNMPGRNSYNVMNVVAHELGHQFGLDDLGAPHSALTMYGLIGKGELNKATLGRGDMRGAERLSP